MTEKGFVGLTECPTELLLGEFVHLAAAAAACSADLRSGGGGGSVVVVATVPDKGLLSLLSSFV